MTKFGNVECVSYNTKKINEKVLNIQFSTQVRFSFMCFDVVGVSSVFAVFCKHWASAQLPTHCWGFCSAVTFICFVASLSLFFLPQKSCSKGNILTTFWTVWMCTCDMSIRKAPVTYVTSKENHTHVTTCDTSWCDTHVTTCDSKSVAVDWSS